MHATGAASIPLWKLPSDFREKHNLPDDDALKDIRARIRRERAEQRREQEERLRSSEQPLEGEELDAWRRAEALRNMGFDLAKPDRHILRAAGSFGFISFRKWQDQNDNKPPQADKSELLSTMSVVEDFARGQNEYVTYVDNAIWMLCARSGLGLSNFELSKIAGQTD